jgi:hypothetical protein
MLDQIRPHGLKSVTVVTFDELLRKLEHLLEVLRGQTVAQDPTSSQQADEEHIAAIQDLEGDLDQDFVVLSNQNSGSKPRRRPPRPIRA